MIFQYGVIGAKFVTIACVVDDSKHYRAFASSLGSLKRCI